MEWPDQNVPESKKDPETEEGKKWLKKHFEYARQYLLYDQAGGDQSRIAKIKKRYDAFNGKVTPENYDHLTNYGRSGEKNKDSKFKFVDYNIGREKIDHLTGEWLKRPLNKTVSVVNETALQSKMNYVKTMMGIKEAYPELQELREKTQLNIMGGMKPPDEKEEKEEFDPKLQGELATQKAIDDYQRDKETKTTYSKNVTDAVIQSECFWRVFMDESTGEVYDKRISPERMIFTETEEEDTIESSPFIGHWEYLPMIEVLRRYDFTKEEVNNLKEIAKGDGDDQGDWWSSGDFKSIGNETYVRLIHLQWKSVEPKIKKISPDNKSISGDGYITPYELNLKATNWEKYKKFYKNKASNGAFQIKERYRQQLYSGVMIGKDIMKNAGKQSFVMRRRNQPGKVYYDYEGCLIRTFDGIRKPISDVIFDLSGLYNTILYKLKSEISTAVGDVIFFDLASLPKGASQSDVMKDIHDDKIAFYNSNQEGAELGANPTTAGFNRLQNQGNGLIQQLVGLKIEIDQTLDRLTGLNRERQGNVPASATATGTAQNVEASRTTTEPLFYLFDRFIERSMTKVAEKLKISYGILNPEYGQTIVGKKGSQMFKYIWDYSLNDYQIYITNGSKEKEIWERLKLMAERSANSGQLPLPYWLKVELSETVDQAVKMAEEGFDKYQDIQMKIEKQKEEQRRKTVEAQEQKRKEAVEDQQKHQHEMEDHETSNEMKKQAHEAKLESKLAEEEGDQLRSNEQEIRDQ